MKRRSFLAAGAALATNACARSATQRTPFFDEIRAAREKTATLVVRHLGAYVTTRFRQRIEDIAALAPVGTTHDVLAIAEALDAILDAKPAATTLDTEQRWHLAFLDARGGTVLIVTASIFAPHTGSIAGERVRFENAGLTAFLAKHYAPDEVKLSER